MLAVIHVFSFLVFLKIERFASIILKIERFASIVSVIMSLCIHSFSHTPFHSDEKNLFLVQDGNKGFGYHSLFRLPLSGTIFLLTSGTAVLSHSSKLLCLLLPTLSYFYSIGCCTSFDLDFVADVFTG